MAEHIVSSYDNDLQGLRQRISEMGGIAEKILANAPGGAVYIEQTDKNAGGFFTVPKVVE